MPASHSKNLTVRRGGSIITALSLVSFSLLALFGAMGASLTISATAGASPATASAQPHVGADPGGGYWLNATDGGIFNYGTAGYHGSTGGIVLNKPIVGIAPTVDGNGYWEVASDGGIFAFGDAKFHGSTGGITLNKPIVGMATTLDGGGYWLVASDGGIFAFGDAKYYGSTGGITLNKPIVGMATTSDGKGYWLVASDGGIFAFGDAGFHGSTGGSSIPGPIVGIADTPDGLGYWLVGSDGSVYNFGDGRDYGSPAASGIALNKPIVAIAVAPSGGAKISPTNLTGVSCPSTTFCQAVDADGNIITYSNGTWSSPLAVDHGGEFDGVSCPTTIWCMAVSYLNGITIYQNGKWSALTEPAGIGHGFHAISCSSSSFCGAEVDNFGDLAFYKSGTWSEPTTNNGISIGQGSTPISCVGTFCMYVNNDGMSQTSTNGSGLSTAIDIPGQTGELQSSVSCSSSSYCEAVNGGAYSAAYWNGSKWTKSANFASSANLNLGINAVSCTGVDCVAVDNSNFYTESGGIVWTGPRAFDLVGEEAQAVSCALPTFCVAVDYKGYAFVLHPYS